VKVLLIEDDAVARRIIERSLRDAGYDVAFAFDAISAVARVREESPDLIVLDLGLPGGGGVIVLQRLKGIEAMSKIPVVVLSAKETARDEALAAGADAFVAKSSNLDELIAAVGERLA
jgi:two-component system, OmpR family, KDP operon response regulator KdpE